MDAQKKKCSSKKHLDVNAISYCQECEISLCNKCQNFHSELFENHHLKNFEKDKKDIFVSICKERGHNQKLEYYCKNHNKLCCASCLCKIKDKINGQHNNCDVYQIQDIIEEKKSKLEENIKLLENISQNIEKSIEEIKELSQKVYENRDALKLKIQKIFTKIRNIINDREDEILNEVDDKYNKLYFEEDAIKESEKLPRKIKMSLTKSKILQKQWDDNNKNELVSDCIDIENNIKTILEINKGIKNCNLYKNITFKFSGDNENELNNFIKTIKLYGKIYYNNSFVFKQCPQNITEERKYKVTGDKLNILTKLGSNGRTGTICEMELDPKVEEYKWKIKILKSQANSIMVGVAPNNFDICSSDYSNCGFYFYCANSCLYSGNPFLYDGKSTNLNKVQNEIDVVMNMEKRSLKFIVDNNETDEISYVDIPLDKPLVPAIFLYHVDDSIEICEYK